MFSNCTLSYRLTLSYFERGVSKTHTLRVLHFALLNVKKVILLQLVGADIFLSIQYVMAHYYFSTAIFHQCSRH